MGDTLYRTVRLLGRHPFWLSSRPVVIGAQHTQRAGGFLLASNHQSPFDIPLLICHTRRIVDFVSNAEVFEKPLVGWFYGAMNALPLHRSRADPTAVRMILDRVGRGRCVAIFPEGGIRRGRLSVVHSRKLHPGTARIAKLAGVPIVPAVIIGSGDYARVKSWLPIRQTRYGVAFGEAFEALSDDETTNAHLADQMVSLHQQLADALGRSIPATTD